MGCLGGPDDHATSSSSATRWSAWAEVGRNVSDFAPGDLVSGEGHVVVGGVVMPCRPPPPVRPLDRPGRRSRRRVRRIRRPAGDRRLASLPGIDEEVAAIFDPFGNAVHTALALEGEDVLICGAGPIGLMATAVAAPRRRPARRGERAGTRSVASGERMGASDRHRPASEDLARRRVERARHGRRLRRRARDVGQPRGHRSAIASMAHGGSWPSLGIPDGEVSLDLDGG